VLEAAGTKWNFHRYFPGLVGGHCIGVDPYYLVYKAKAMGFHANVILAGRQINDSMGFYIGQYVAKWLSQQGKSHNTARVLVMGATFKENVADIRNSKVADVVNELKSFSMHVDWVDPHADAEEVMHEYNHPLVSAPAGQYDSVVVAVSHQEYVAMGEADLQSFLSPGGLLVDIKGIFKNKIENYQYWSL
jgi:UDP-N-acetyl-D-galactosamine dehydrogenase